MKTLAKLASIFVLCTTSAIAADVTLTGWAFGSSVDVATNMYAGPAGAYAGSLSGTGLFDTPSFVTYCVELTEQFSFSPQPMTGYAVIPAAVYFQSQLKATDMFRLLAANTVTSPETSASMQLAIWNIVYDNDKTLTSGAFTDASPYASAATSFLNTAAVAPRFDFELFILQKSGSQDFIAMIPTPTAVPEPSIFAMLLAGIGIIGYRARKF